VIHDDIHGEGNSQMLLLTDDYESSRKLVLIQTQGNSCSVSRESVSDILLGCFRSREVCKINPSQIDRMETQSQFECCY
jgi:hypothetical protein